MTDIERQSWNSVKAKLAGKNEAHLLTTIKELWNLSQQNKEFIVTKLKLQVPDDLLPRYRERVRHPFFPKRGIGNLDLKSAKAAISEYFKVTGDLVGKLDLMLLYVESGTEFTNAYGDINERFYLSLESTFDKFSQAVKENTNLLSQFISRLKILRKKSRDIGWGYGDYICDEVDELLAMD